MENIGKNHKYQDIFYENLFKEIALKRGIKSITKWCEENNIDRTLIYQSTLAAKRGRPQNFSTILMLADIAGKDLIDLLNEPAVIDEYEK